MLTIESNVNLENLDQANKKVPPPAEMYKLLTKE